MSFNIKSDLEKDIINLDGRVSKGSSRQETEYQDKIKPLNVLNAYSVTVQTYKIRSKIEFYYKIIPKLCKIA